MLLNILLCIYFFSVFCAVITINYNNMWIILNIYFVPADEMNQANEELRDTIKSIWPLQAKKMLDLLIPRNEGKVRSSLSNEIHFVILDDRAMILLLELTRDKLTVGKIYVCLLILESWRSTRFGQLKSAEQVSLPLAVSSN